MTQKSSSSLLLLLFLFFLTHLPCSQLAHPIPSHLNNSEKKRQDNVLGLLYTAKHKPNSSGIDTTPFNPILHLDHTAIVHPQDGLKESDRIRTLPGQPPVDFAQYGGYVTVDKAAGRAMFYYFVEAPSSNKDSLPLLLWLNGGPGCSSLGYGAMLEIGPFRVHSDGKTLYRNRYSWNNAANVLFVESPAGVGFSYSNRTSDYNSTGDRKTAEDNYVFLLNWLERFPEFKTRDFYIAGESYAGHYVPQLAHTILSHNNKANKTLVNLKGVLMGNAVINDDTDEKGIYEYLVSHAIITEEAAHQMEIHCDYSPNVGNATKECNEAADEIEKDLYYLDIYNIYAPTCFSANLTTKPRRLKQTFDPCSDVYVNAYLNRGDVQEALHANVTKLTHEWQHCGGALRNWLDSPSTIIPVLQDIMATGLRVWYFSGDMDGRVPFISTKYSIKKMNLAVKTRWNPWYLQGEIGGYTQEYKGELTFATVRGAGHQVPSYQPVRALSLVSHFLAGKPLPNTSNYPGLK